MLELASVYTKLVRTGFAFRSSGCQEYGACMADERENRFGPENVAFAPCSCLTLGRDSKGERLTVVHA